MQIQKVKKGRQLEMDLFPAKFPIFEKPDNSQNTNELSLIFKQNESSLFYLPTNENIYFASLIAKKHT